jgi:hypothetical protein
MDRLALDAAYRATTYRVHAPERAIDVRIARGHPELDALLAAMRAETWAVVTACNPRSRPESPEVNRERHARLVEAVERTGLLHLEADGVPADDRWTPERSLFVAGLSRQQAASLGHRFEQNAIVYGVRGGVAELVWLE